MHVLRSSPSLAAAMHPSLRARASSSPSQVCAVSFFIGPGAMGTGRAVVRVVTVRGWRNWRMLGLHPGETLITLLPTFCCSVPRGVFFFFSSVLLAVVFLISEELSVALYQKKGCFSFWVGGVAYVENFPFLLSPLWQLATCLFLWGHSLSPERHSFADQCRLPHNWCKSADPHFRHSF